MSKIDELLKNEKVEWKKLGDIADIRVVQPKKKIKKQEYLESGKYPIVDQGQKFVVGYTNNREYLFEINSYIVFGDHTETLKYVNFGFAQGADGIKVIRTDEDKLNSKYLYHAILNFYEKTGKYKRHFSALKNTRIPIPSLETQEKIVEILDKFTDYVTELQAELQDRTKQYEYYRDMLLSEDYLSKLARNPELIGLDNRIKITTLGEIGVFTRGNGLQKKDFVSKGKPVIHYGQIYTKYNFESNKTFSFVNEEVFSKLKKANCNDILIATTSENIEDVGKAVVWLGDEEIGFSGDMYSYSTTQNSKYIAYYLQTTEFQRQKEKKVTGTKLIRIHGNDMAKFPISLPPIKIQNKVVEVLDKFQSLLADTEGLLPQEIEQRQKQYEYFREKLLTFDENVVSKQASKIISNRYFDLLEEACDFVGIDFISCTREKLSDCIRETKNIKWDNEEEFNYIDLSSIDRQYNSILETNLVNKNNAPSRARQLIKEKDILFGTTRPLLKRYYFVEEEYDGQLCSTGFCVLRANEEKILPKWIYYNIMTSKFLEFVKMNEKGTSYPAISDFNVKQFKIPVPPLAVQEHVVSILDKFDELINDISTGIPKEIELRQKEYEYYRERLLSFPR
ncbi:hypothetical protein DN0046_03490 [Finegoldia magna]